MINDNQVLQNLQKQETKSTSKVYSSFTLTNLSHSIYSRRNTRGTFEFQIYLVNVENFKYAFPFPMQSFPEILRT